MRSRHHGRCGRGHDRRNGGGRRSVMGLPALRAVQARLKQLL
jgi:hypothetical protein